MPRPRLSEQLAAAASAKLMLVCAPAGFGKTTAVCQWIHHTAGQASWISLDELDNDPVRFWRHVIAAINMSQAGMGRKFSALLHSQLTVPTEKLMSVFLEEISPIRGDFYIVLDDYHLIREPSIHDGMQFLIQYAHSSIHTVIISREEPPFLLHRLRVRKQLMQLGMDSLRFTEEESGCFFNDLMEMGLSKQDTLLLSKRTEGWIAGMQLAVLSIKGKEDASSFIQRFSGNNKFIADYLTEEVLTRLSERVQLFLLKTSFLSRFSGPLCSAVTGEKDAHAILRKLEQTNSFVMALDDAHEWYRYHQLFADILYRLLLHKHGDQLAGLHIAASEWFERQGLMMEAIEHSLAGNDWNRAARLIADYAPWILKQSETITLRRWMQRFARTSLECHPGLCIAFAWMHTLADEINQAETLLRLAEQSLLTQDEESFDDYQVEIFVIRGYIELMRKNVELSVRYIESSVQ